MPFRPAANAAIQAYSSRPTNTVGWMLDVDKLGASPHIQATLTSMDGFHFVFTILDSEGLDIFEIEQVCMHDTVDEIRRRRSQG